MQWDSNLCSTLVNKTEKPLYLPTQILGYWTACKSILGIKQGLLVGKFNYFRFLGDAPTLRDCFCIHNKFPKYFHLSCSHSIPNDTPTLLSGFLITSCKYFFCIKRILLSYIQPPFPPDQKKMGRGLLLL